MTKTEILFLLLRTELWQIPLSRNLDIPADMFDQLMSMSEMQTVDGLVTGCLMNGGVGLERICAARVLVIQQYIGQQNYLINEELKTLCTLLTKHDIRFFVVKGQTIAARYPHPAYRTCGDIDFYVYPECFDKARKIIETEWKVQVEDDDEGEQHLHFMHHDIVFEMHYSLMQFSSGRNQKRFDRLIAESPLVTVDIEGVKVPTLGAELNLVYTFLHLYHHLIEIGVGLRQFCDVAVLMKSMPLDEEQKAVVLHILRSLDFEKAFHAIETVLHKTLGLPREKMLMPVIKGDMKRCSFILDVVFRRGNFGKYGRQHQVRSGWKYNIEAFQIKVRHYGTLLWLSPRENIAFLCKTLPNRVLRFLR